MAGLPHFKTENLGSVLKIQAAPVEAFLSFPTLVAFSVDEAQIKFRRNAAWYDIYCTPQTMGYQQEGKEDGNGTSFSQQVVGFVPGDEPDLEQAWLTLFYGHLWILRITLATGRVKLIGSPTSPLTLETRQSTGTTPGDAAGTQITFLGASIYRTPFLTSDIIMVPF